MEDDNEITFRLPSATEPRYNLRRQQEVTDTSANRTSSDGEIESGTQKLSRRNVSARKSRDSNTSASLESELRRINEHIEELKRHASRREKLEGNPSRSSGFVEQPVPLGATCSNEPLATHSGSSEQLGPSEPTCSTEPFCRSSGSAEQLCSDVPACSTEPLYRVNLPVTTSNLLMKPNSNKGPLVVSDGLRTGSNRDSVSAERVTKQGRESSCVTLPHVEHQYRMEVEKPPAIRLDKYDGKSCLETYLAKFRYISEHFGWNEKQQLLYLRTHLEGAAGDLLWSHPELSTLEAVVKLLQNRFGTQNQRERFRVELRTRRRKLGEDLQSLYQDIVRLMSLAYNNEKSEAVEVVSRDAFLEALDDPELHFRILEHDPKTIDDAL